MEKGNRLLIGGTYFGSAATDPEDTIDRERLMRPPLDPGDLAARSAFGARRRKVIAQLLHMRLADRRRGIHVRFPIDRGVDPSFDDREGIGPSGDMLRRELRLRSRAQGEITVLRSVVTRAREAPLRPSLWNLAEIRRRLRSVDRAVRARGTRLRPVSPASSPVRSSSISL